MFFLICPEELHSLEAPISFVFQLQLEGGYNPQCSLATTGRWIQPPVLAPSCHPEAEVE